MTTQTVAPSAPMSKAAKAALDVAQTANLLFASACVQAFVAGETEIVARALDLDNAKVGQLDRFEKSLTGCASITADVWARDFAPVVSKALIASGIYSPGKDGKYLGAVTMASTLKVCAMALTAGMKRLDTDTKVRDFAGRARAFLVKAGAIDAPKGKAKGRPVSDKPVAGVTGKSLPADPLAAFTECAMMLCADDLAMANNLVTVCMVTDTRERLAMLLTALVTPAKGRPVQ